MKTFKEIFNIFILNIKFLLKNKGKALANLAIVFFALLVPIFFVPLKTSISLVFFLGAIIPSSIIYVSTTFNWRNSTLNLNLKTSSSERSIFYIGSYLTMNLFAFIEMFIILFFLLVFQKTGILMYGWRGAEAVGRGYNILNIDIYALVYSIFESILVMFAILFFVQNITDSEKTVYLIVVIIIIFSIILGGIFNYNFSHTGWVDPNNHDDKYGIYNENIFGEKLYYPIAIAFPLFGPMQHLSTLRFSINTFYSTKIIFFIFQNNLNMEFSEALHWDILWFLPYIHTILFASTSIIITKYKR